MNSPPSSPSSNRSLSPSKGLCRKKSRIPCAIHVTPSKIIRSVPPFRQWPEPPPAPIRTRTTEPRPVPSQTKPLRPGSADARFRRLIPKQIPEHDNRMVTEIQSFRAITDDASMKLPTSMPYHPPCSDFKQELVKPAVLTSLSETNCERFKDIPQIIKEQIIKEHISNLTALPPERVYNETKFVKHPIVSDETSKNENEQKFLMIPPGLEATDIELHDGKNVKKLRLRVEAEETEYVIVRSSNKSSQTEIVELTSEEEEGEEEEEEDKEIIREMEKISQKSNSDKGVSKLVISQMPNRLAIRKSTKSESTETMLYRAPSDMLTKNKRILKVFCGAFMLLLVCLLIPLSVQFSIKFLAPRPEPSILQQLAQYAKCAIYCLMNKINKQTISSTPSRRKLNDVLLKTNT